MAENTVYALTVTQAYASPCTINYEGGNFYVAYASIKNVTGYCNTDHVGPWTNIIVVNTNYQTGNDVSTTQFGAWAQSTLAGTFFFLEWEVCQENPVGQTYYYFCNYGNAGPLF
jgi:hypothetical protein